MCTVLLPPGVNTIEVNIIIIIIIIITIMTYFPFSSVYLISTIKYCSARLLMME